MKQRKRVLLAALLMAVALLSSAFSTTAFAASPTSISAETVEAAPGSSVSVNVNIENNPGILGMALKVDYDSALTLKSGISGDAFSALSMTKPGVFQSGCRFVWDGQDLSTSDIKDGTILTLAFDVSADATPGQSLNISLTCIDPVDANLMAVDVNTVNGAVQITGGSTVEATPESLAVAKDDVEYSVGETVSFDDLQVLVTYSDNSVKVLDASQYTVDSSAIDMSTPGVYPIKVSYAEGDVQLQESVSITVNGVLESIKATKTKTTYTVGDALNVNDLLVMATYSGNQRKKVETYTTNASEIDMSTAGEKVLTVTYVENGVTATDIITIIVEKPSLVSIEAKKTKTVYNQGDTLAVNDIVVVATYSNGKRERVTNFTTDADDIDMSTIGEKTLTVAYDEDGVIATDIIAITVNEAGSVEPGDSDLMYLNIEEPEYGEYYFMVGDKLDLSGLQVYATYYSKDDPVLLDESQYELDYSDLYADPEDEWSEDAIDAEGTLIAEGFFLIKVTLKGEDPENYACIWVNVGSSSYLIEAEASKLVYEPGDAVSLKDLKVTIRYADGTTAVADNDDLYVVVRDPNDEDDYGTPIDEADLSKIGDYELVITYQEGWSEEATAVVPISVRKDIVKAATVAKIVSDNSYSTTYMFGIPCIPKVEVSGLTEGKDYQVQYKDNVNAGKAKALIVGIGDYSGVKEIDFDISPMAMWLTMPEISITSAICTGKAITPAVRFQLGDLKQGIDYKLVYGNNLNVGVATVRVVGMGNYQGSKTVTFKIMPGKATIGKVKGAKKKAKVKWGKLPGGVKYQVQYRMGKGKWKTKTASKNSLTIKKLKSKKKYQFRVRALKNVSGEIYYGAWSKVKKVKIK